MALRKHGKLRFNPVPYLLGMAFADGELFGLDSSQGLKEMDSGSESIRLLWRQSVMN